MTDQEFGKQIMHVVNEARDAGMSLDEVIVGLSDARETMADIRRNALEDAGAP